MVLPEQRIAAEQDKPRSKRDCQGGINAGNPAVLDAPPLLDEHASGQRQIIAQARGGQQHEHRTGQPERQSAHHA
jgi:hypothetical protein